jgi:hypothetical protein
MRWLKTIALAFAGALSFGALADEQGGAFVFESQPAIYGPPPGLPLRDEELEELRGGSPPPMVQQAGVVLWDEPRKPLPPQRTNAIDSPSSNSIAGAVMNVTASFNRH